MVVPLQGKIAPVAIAGPIIRHFQPLKPYVPPPGTRTPKSHPTATEENQLDAPKPRRRASQHNEAAIRHWCSDEWSKLYRKAVGCGQTVVFMDEAGVQLTVSRQLDRQL